MDVPLKPNILEDIGRDVGATLSQILLSGIYFSIPLPPPPPKYLSSQDTIVLEDESGRISLISGRLKREQYVTGIIMAAPGIETPDGEFKVVDVCFAEMAPHVQIDRMVTKSEDDMESTVMLSTER